MTQSEKQMLKAEIILPKRVVKQPTPALNAGGDCWACVLAGLFGWRSPSSVYDRLNDSLVTGFTRPDMSRLLYRARTLDLIDRLVTGCPVWLPHEGPSCFGLPSWHMSLEWFDYLSMAFDAGYYGIASVSYNKQGPISETDHVVLLCGSREVERCHPRVENSWIVHQEVLVSCSARSSPLEVWVDVIDFLKYQGGFNCFLARPTK